MTILHFNLIFQALDAVSSIFLGPPLNLFLYTLPNTGVWISLASQNDGDARSPAPKVNFDAGPDMLDLRSLFVFSNSHTESDPLRRTLASERRACVP
jgi:hypothetical protein